MAQPTAELEARREQIEQELKHLARASLRGGVGAIGYRSKPFDTADTPYWVQVDLQEEYEISEVVLVPVLWRDVNEGFRADAFPSAFQVRAGTAANPKGEVIAEYELGEDESLGIAPLVISVAETLASWVRIEATRLSTRTYDDRYVFQLSEFFVFSQGKDVALRKPVRASVPKPRDPSGAWDEAFLVDGGTPYLMNSARGDSSHGFIAGFDLEPVLTIDLGAVYPISTIHLHALEQSDTVPQAFVGDLGIPKHFKIEGSLSPDFTNSVLLVNHRPDDATGGMPILMWNIPETNCRYVRLITIEKSESFGVTKRLSRIGFAEIELLADGDNVAKGRPVWSQPEASGARQPDLLTDGVNRYGEILETQDWLRELARRHDLGVELQGLMAELEFRNERRKTVLVWLGRVTVLLVFTVAFLVLYGRMLRIRNEARVRQRIAANLHDELGANLHAIGMWSDIAQSSVDSPDSLKESLQRIRSLTERTGTSARLCSNMLEAKGVCEVLVDDMKREASRLLADIHYEISFDEEARINSIPRRKRIDIFMFFKESLANIIRHGQATSARIALSLKKNEVSLIIADDGCGFSGGLPNSLQRRARLMRAKAGVEHPQEGGTLVWLKLKIR
jgi:signal transduction histidine kinase